MRLPTGGSEIDRGAPIRFRFDDVEYEGFAGDTIASALLANDVRVVGRGIYTGRPRGVFSAGSEEPNAIVQVRWPSGTSEPSLRATVVEIADGMEAWSLAGRGRLEGEDRGRFDRKYVHVETLVVGGGTAGRAAAARDSGTAGCSSSTKGPSSSRSKASQVLPACDGPRDLRPRLRPRRRAAAGAPDRGPAVAHPGGSDRAGHRRARTTDPVSRQRPPRGHAGQRGGGVCRALRGAPRTQFRARDDERLGVRVRVGAPGGGGRAGQGRRPPPGRACRRQRGRAAARVGRLEPEPRALVTGRRPPPVRRPDRRIRPGWRAAERRGRRNSDRRRAAGQLRARRGTAPATRTPRSSTWNGTRPWPTSVERWAPG